MYWILWILCTAFVALAGEELAHVANPASGPGLVQTALELVQKNSPAAAKKPEPVAVAVAEEAVPDRFDGLARTMHNMGDSGITEEMAERRVKCVENGARQKLGLTPIGYETPAQADARRHGMSWGDKMKMTSAMMDEQPDWGC